MNFQFWTPEEVREWFSASTFTSGLPHAPLKAWFHTSMLLSTLRKVKAIPPPMIISLTWSNMLLISWILSWTLALVGEEGKRKQEIIIRPNTIWAGFIWFKQCLFAGSLHLPGDNYAQGRRAILVTQEWQYSAWDAPGLTSQGHPGTAGITKSGVLAILQQQHWQQCLGDKYSALSIFISLYKYCLTTPM